MAVECGAHGPTGCEAPAAVEFWEGPEGGVNKFRNKTGQFWSELEEPGLPFRQ